MWTCTAGKYTKIWNPYEFTHFKSFLPLISVPLKTRYSQGFFCVRCLSSFLFFPFSFYSAVSFSLHHDWTVVEYTSVFVDLKPRVVLGQGRSGKLQLWGSPPLKVNKQLKNKRFYNREIWRYHKWALSGTLAPPTRWRMACGGGNPPTSATHGAGGTLVNGSRLGCLGVGLGFTVVMKNA